MGEIETRIDNTLFGQVGEPRKDHPYFRGEHARLLIRAVRELGAAWIEAMGDEFPMSDEQAKLWWGISPDVLALLEGLGDDRE